MLVTDGVSIRPERSTHELVHTMPETDQLFQLIRHGIEATVRRPVLVSDE